MTASVLHTAARPWFAAKLSKYLPAGLLANATTTVAAATGTPQRTTFATSSVTLPQLAGVVMAMLEDLKTSQVLK